MEDADESRYVGAGRLTREWIFRCQLDDVARGTNHDLAFDSESFRELNGNLFAQGRLTHIFAHNKRADRADVHDAQFCQLLREQRRLASVRSTDVDRSKKDDPHKLRS